VILPCNYKKYQEVAQVFREIISEYDPDFESMGLDEVNLDVTPYLESQGMDNTEGRQELA